MIDASKINHQFVRKQRQDLNERRRQELLPVAKALRDPLLSVEVVRSAMNQVCMWRARGLCSRDYIEAWEALLSQPEKAAKMLEDQSPRGFQMRQNSPFVSTVRKLQGKYAA